MNSKLPGLSMQTVVTELDLTYRRRFSDFKIPEAYESLILDAMKGDHSNFVRDDELDASWRIFTPLLRYLDENKDIIPMEYPYGEHELFDLGECFWMLNSSRLEGSGRD
jgi:glucose-6-phosphate 1-dehydrogenase